MQACFCGTSDGKTLEESAMEGVNIIIIRRRNSVHYSCPLFDNVNKD